MYNKIPTKIKLIKTSPKITYANAFESKFFLLLRERRVITLQFDMPASAIEVEENMLLGEKIKTRMDNGKRYKRKQKEGSLLTILGCKNLRNVKDNKKFIIKIGKNRDEGKES